MLVTVIGIILGVIVSKECNGLLLLSEANGAKVLIKTFLGTGGYGKRGALCPLVSTVNCGITSRAEEAMYVSVRRIILGIIVTEIRKSLFLYLLTNATVIANKTVGGTGRCYDNVARFPFVSIVYGRITSRAISAVALTVRNVVVGIIVTESLNVLDSHRATYATTVRLSSAKQTGRLNYHIRSLPSMFLVNGLGATQAEAAVVISARKKLVAKAVSERGKRLVRSVLVTFRAGLVR